MPAHEVHAKIGVSGNSMDIQLRWIRFSFLLILTLVVMVSCRRPYLSETPIGSMKPRVEAQNPDAERSPTNLPTVAPTRTRFPTVTDSPVLGLTITTTSLPSATPVQMVRFAIIGDYGLAGDPLRDVAEIIKGWEPDFILTTGDNNYPDGKAENIDANIGQYFHEFIYPYTGVYGHGADRNRFFPVLGNHDWNSDQARPYLDYFDLPGNERYYDFVWGPVHFFALDSDSREPDGVGRSSIQAEWLRDKLANTMARWKVVYMHQPPYASSGDGSIDWIQWPFDAWGADVVICGHSHVYERIEIDGFTYLVNGLGGSAIYSFGDPVPGSLVRFNQDYGALRVEASQEQIIFQFLTRTGEAVDTWGLYGDD